MSHRETWLSLEQRAKPLVRAGMILGLGLGGFFDGIVFHQILQWHHMVSAHGDPSVAGDLELNVLADASFTPLPTFSRSSALACCGEGGAGPTLLWDVSFLVWGVLFILGGYAIVRTDDAVPSDTQRVLGGIRGE